MRFWNNLSKHQSGEVGLGCSGTKTVAHARPSKLLTQPLMKEAKQWVGFSWTKPFFCPQPLRGGRRRGFVFPSSPCGIDTTRLSSSGEAAGSLFSPFGNATSHTRGTIWSSLLPTASIPVLCLLDHQPVICASRGSTCCYDTQYIHRTGRLLKM